MAAASTAVVAYSAIGYRSPTPVSSSIRCSSSSVPNHDMKKEEQSRTAVVVRAAGSNIEGRKKGRRRDWSVSSSVDESDVIPLLNRSDPTNSKTSLAGVGGGRVGGGGQPRDDLDRLVDRTINATVALAAGSFAITKLLTIDHDYWHGWTLFEILRYAPQHNWTAYEEALETNPVLSKMMISGIVYSLGDWIAQCFEGKPLLDIDRTRIFRSGLVGFTLHGSLSHHYYNLCEALFPFEAWWVVPAKVAFDQTVWCALWNSIYFVVLGFLRLESPVNIYGELTKTFWPMLTAGWKLWPFAHLITYGVVPVEQRLLWVDSVELIWVTILSTYSNEKSDIENSEVVSETDVKS